MARHIWSPGPISAADHSLRDRTLKTEKGCLVRRGGSSLVSETRVGVPKMDAEPSDFFITLPPGWD